MSSQVTLSLHPNEEIVYDLHSLHDLLSHLQLVWYDHGRHPDCQFTSFIHATKKKVPGLEVIMEVRSLTVHSDSDCVSEDNGPIPYNYRIITV